MNQENVGQIFGEVFKKMKLKMIEERNRKSPIVIRNA